MTTDQIKDAESAVGATGGSTDPDAAFERATNEARQIIAKARYEAFRTVTGARNDADSILDNARSEAAAHVAAIEANDTIAAENADLVAINAALRVEYNELLDAIDVSETLIEGFEVRLLDLATMPDSLASHAELLAGASAEVSAEVTPFVFDYSPSVAPPPKPSRSKSTERAESFYSRKSAKLPRIGSEGGRQAMEVVRSMRDRMRDQGAS